MHKLVPVVSIALLLAACADPDDPVDADVPDTSQAGLDEFLDSKGFEDWTSDPEPRDPIENSGSPHGLVRTYFGPLLEDSLNDFGGEHPVGAAAIKEAYSDADTVSHYFIYVRSKEGDIDDSFVWYRQDTGSYFDGSSFCSDCHASTDGNQDGTITPLP
jgi:hypothetical protein